MISVYQNTFKNTSVRRDGQVVHDYLEPDTPGLPRMVASTADNAAPTPTSNPDGVMLQTQSTDGGQSSRGAYLVLDALTSSGTLTAELEFEQPQGPPDPIIPLPQPVWAVALAFTNGDEANPSGTVRMDVTCQFLDNGNTVNLGHTGGAPHAIDLGNRGVDPGYSAFAANNTQFKLAIQICRSENNVTSCYGELLINGSLVAQGTLNQQAPPLVQMGTNPLLITAVGFSIVSQNGYNVSAVFRSFTLKYEIGPCHPLHIPKYSTGG